MHLKRGAGACFKFPARKMRLNLLICYYYLLLIAAVVVVSGQELDGVAAPDENLCSICHESLGGDDTVSLIRCGHSFHQECTLKLAQHKHTNCPLCRQEILNFKSISRLLTEMEDNFVNSVHDVNELYRQHCSGHVSYQNLLICELIMNSERLFKAYYMSIIYVKLSLYDDMFTHDVKKYTARYKLALIDYKKMLIVKQRNLARLLLNMNGVNPLISRVFNQIRSIRAQPTETENFGKLKSQVGLQTVYCSARLNQFERGSGIYSSMPVSRKKLDLILMRMKMFGMYAANARLADDVLMLQQLMTTPQKEVIIEVLNYFLLNSNVYTIDTVDETIFTV